MKDNEKHRETLVRDIQELRQNFFTLKKLYDAFISLHNNNNNNNDSAPLRQKAEAILNDKPLTHDSQLSEVENLKLIYELQIHQIELKMQNEELRNAQAETEAANDRYIELYDFAPSGYYTLSRESEILEINLIGAVMLGKDRSYLKNSRFDFFVSNDTKAVFNLFLQKAFKSKVKETCDVTLTTPGNQPIYVHLSGVATKNRKQCMVTAVDTTERKITEQQIHNLNANLELKVTQRTAQLAETNKNLENEIQRRILVEAELAREKRRLSDIIKGTNLGTWEWNIQTGETLFNEQWAEIIGYTLDEISPVSIETWIKFSHPDDLIKSDELLGKHFNGTLDYYSFESRMKHKNGKWIWVLDRGKIHTWDNDGKPLLMSGTHKDITERKRAEEDLEESREKYRGLSEASLESIFLSEKGVCIEQNLTAEKMFGYTSEEALTRYGTEWIVPEDREMVMNNMLLGHEKTYEATALRKDGTTFPCALSGKMMFYKGRNVRVTSLSDITERKQAVEALVEAKKEAENANLAKSEFLSRMSHELRTPMNSILGFAQLIEMDELTPSHKKGVRHILNSGKHLLNLINEVLDISGIESGSVSLSYVPVQLSRIISETLDTVHPSASAMHVKLGLINAGNDQLFVKADYHRLRQVLLNLINNAIKYNREGGSVIIKTELQQAIASEIAFVRITVSDTGRGINPEFFGKLFLPFERIGAEKTGIEGTGLGLMVVKKLMDAMGGRVGVKSVPREGSTFWIELPHIADQETEAEQTEYRPVSNAVITKKTGTILYIEDNASNTALVEQILVNHRSTIHLITSTKGAQTVSLAIEYAPDLILLDLDLPDIMGFEVIKLLQAEEKTKDIPVIVISADAMPKQIEKLMKAGAVGYLTKPLDVAEFLRMIDEETGINKLRV